MSDHEPVTESTIPAHLTEWQMGNDDFVAGRQQLPAKVFSESEYVAYLAGWESAQKAHAEVLADASTNWPDEPEYDS